VTSRFSEGSNPSEPDVARIIASVVESGIDSELGYETSLWDLIVTPLPVSAPPLDVVSVRGSYTKARPGHVLIEHWRLVGLADSIEREESEAVRLFWRFMREKYGLVANNH
jgi:hypothetical protein